MISSSHSKVIAHLLLEIKAITLNLQTPYRFTSGILSPIYCDNRLIISYPDKRKIIIDAFLDLISQHQLKTDVIAGTATAGIPHAAWLADRLNKPMVYVRSSSKGHGKQNQIEGTFTPKQQALVVEDLISTGNSSVSAGLALQEAGAIVQDCIAIFTYGFESAKQCFEKANINLFTLTDFPSLIEVANQQGYINNEEKDQALLWNKNPSQWEKTISVK